MIRRRRSIGEFAFVVVSRVALGGAILIVTAVGMAIVGATALAGVAVALARIIADPNRSIIRRPPAGWLLKLADDACRKATADMIREMVADMRVEHYQALNEGRTIKARWINVLYYVAMARSLTIDRLVGAAINYVLGAIRMGKP